MRNTGGAAGSRLRLKSPPCACIFALGDANGRLGMNVGDRVEVSGFVTQAKYLLGRSLSHIESLLGFQAGRLANGANFATLERLPTIDEFETAGYSQVAAHRHVMPTGLDPRGLRKMAMSVWALNGPDRLVKVMAITRHDPRIADDVQYPPGQGVPQWKLIRPIPARVASVLLRGADIFRL